jgi:hypothetical protein
VATGEVDVVVGTHRLLSGDLKFKNLGLLVVDEEQRFGVSHKESIKQFRAEVDVLTLSATPIPRTLEMSLTGIRDLSLLNTPPAARQPILTYVGEFDERAVTEAIRRELLREGQVFYVHNRVRDIEQQAARLSELVPEARIAVAHGQMDEGSLEKVVVEFWEGRYDVLVCTTIIESGIDMPTVNTLVVERADLLGLGQLHQLRGRVGRAGQRAYAYLFFPPDRQLSEEAYERLKTIGEATELGSGFRIAMRDLEIRGAGNCWAPASRDTSPPSATTHCQMVNEAIAQLNEPPEEPTIVLSCRCLLPPDSSRDLRLGAPPLASVRSRRRRRHRRGVGRPLRPVPPPAAALLQVAYCGQCVRTGVRHHRHQEPGALRRRAPRIMSPPTLPQSPRCASPALQGSELPRRVRRAACRSRAVRPRRRPGRRAGRAGARRGTRRFLAVGQRLASSPCVAPHPVLAATAVSPCSRRHVASPRTPPRPPWPVSPSRSTTSARWSATRSSTPAPSPPPRAPRTARWPAAR